MDTNYPKWTEWDIIRWKLTPEKIGGGIPYIQKFKDGWVQFHKNDIKKIASQFLIPAELLAGVAWVEVGGDSYSIDYVAYSVRAFDWSGPSWVDKNLTLTNHPSKTSFGAISIQLRVVAETVGIDPKKMTFKQEVALINALSSDMYNLKVVAKHLYNLIKHDFPKDTTPNLLSDEQIRIVGARYNRGVGMSLDKLKLNTKYGDFLLKNNNRIKRLLQSGASGSW